MKKNLGQRALALLLALGLMLGAAPAGALAAGPSGEGSPEVTVSAKFLNEELTQAELTYTMHPVPPAEGEGVNVLFLVDASQGAYGLTVSRLSKALGGYGGAAMLANYGLANQAQVIAYSAEGESVYASGVQNTEAGILSAVSAIPQQTSFAQTADEATGLSAAAGAVQELSASGRPTAVVWLLGERLYTEETAWGQAMQELKQALGSTGKLAVFGCGNEAQAVMEKYASTYRQAGEDADTSAVFPTWSVNGYELYDLTRALGVESYRTAGFGGSTDWLYFTLQLDPAVVAQIDEDEEKTVGRVPVMDSANPGYTYTNITNDAQEKAVQLQVEEIPRQDSVIIKVTVNLQPGLEGKQTLVQAFDMTLPLRTGLFDENTQDVQVHFPAAELNFSGNSITYALGEGVSGTAPEQAAKPGAQVTLHDGAGISKAGQTLGGWLVKEAPGDAGLVGRRYNLGDTITMPNTALVLVPLWGHVGVELEVGQAVPGVPGAQQNRIMESPGVNRVLDFSQVLVNGQKVGQNVVSIVTQTQALEYESANSGEDPLRVNITGAGAEGALYARQIGAEGSNVIAYLQAHPTQAGKYQLVLTAAGGVAAPADSTALFAAIQPNGQGGGSFLDDGWNVNVQSIDLTNFSTEGTVSLQGLFRECHSLTTVTGLAALDTSAAAVFSSMFQGCKSLASLDLTGWDTTSVTDVQQMFLDCASLAEVKGVDGWQMPELVNARYVFGRSGVKKLDLSSWKPEKLQNMHLAFTDCASLTELKMDGWRVPVLETMEKAFQNCTSLAELDLSTWKDVKALQSLYQTFYGCSAMKKLCIPGLVPSYKDMLFYFTFDGMSSLEYLDISNWVLDGHVRNETIEQYWNDAVFCERKPEKLATIKADGWQVTADLPEGLENVMTPMMILGGSSLQQMSINDWNLNDKTISLANMGYGLRAHAAASFTGWTGLGGVTSMAGMFSDMTRLETVALTDCTLSSVTRADMFTSSNARLKTVDFSGWAGISADKLGNVFSGLPAEVAQNVSLTVSEGEIGDALKASLENAKQAGRAAAPAALAAPQASGPAAARPGAGAPVPEGTDTQPQAAVLTADGVPGPGASGDGLVWHGVSSQQGDTYFLKATVKYEGDEGALSGRDVALRVELPVNMQPTGTPQVTTGQFTSTGANEAYDKGGTVVQQPELVQENGRYVLKAVVGNMFTGTELEISFQARLSASGTREGEYVVWDARAVASDANSSASQTYRFWHHEGGSGGSAPESGGQKANPKTGVDGWQGFWEDARRLLGL